MRARYGVSFLRSECDQWSTLVRVGGWGLGGFLRWWPPSTMWVGPIIFLWWSVHITEDVWITPSFSNLGLCACWAHFMCHHKLWPTWVISFFTISLRFAWRKHYEKIMIPTFKPVLQNFAFSRLLSIILFAIPVISPSGWVVIAVSGSVSVQIMIPM